jgi:hypothetical protein
VQSGDEAARASPTAEKERPDELCGSDMLQAATERPGAATCMYACLYAAKVILGGAPSNIIISLYTM